MICSRLLVTLLMKSAPWTLTFCTADAKVAQSKRTARTKPKDCGCQRLNVAERAVRTRDMLIMGSGDTSRPVHNVSLSLKSVSVVDNEWKPTKGRSKSSEEKRREVAGANGHRYAQQRGYVLSSRAITGLRGQALILMRVRDPCPGTQPWNSVKDPLNFRLESLKLRAVHPSVSDSTVSQMNIWQR